MTESGKVVKALESLEQRLLYCGDGLDAWAVNEAVKALKAQEPVNQSEKQGGVDGDTIVV